MERTTAGVVTRLVLDTGYRAVVLDRLVRQAACLLGRSTACIVVRMQDRPDSGIVAAAVGLDDEDVIGHVVDLGAAPPAFMQDAVWSEVPPDTGARGRLAVSGGGLAGAAKSLLDGQAHRVNAALDHGQIPRSMTERILDQAEELTRSANGDSPGSIVELELAMAIVEELALGGADKVEVELAVRLYPLGQLFGESNGSPDPPGIDSWRAAADTVTAVPGLEPLAAILLHLDERFDGRGPAGLSGPCVPIASRIVACARAFRAEMAGGRSEAREVAERLAPDAPMRFGADVADAMMRALRDPATR